MVFARKVWKLLVAIKDGLVLLLLMMFFTLLYAAMTARPSAGVVREGALLLRLEGAVVEEPELVDPLQRLFTDNAPLEEYRARDLVRAIRTAAKDDRIKAVVLDLSRFTGGGMVNLQEIGRAMDEVRAVKKPVLAYSLAYGDDHMLLAAHASEVWVDPMGGAFVVGPGGNHLYFGRLLEKLKVTAHVFRVGTYKSAVEPFIRDSQSPEARAASRALYAALWQDWKADVAKARPKANIRLVTSDPAGWLRASGGDAAKAAVAAGLVDRIGNEVDFGRRVAEIAGPDRFDQHAGSFAHTTLRGWLAAKEPAKRGKAIGVITVAGNIIDGEAGPGTAGGDRIAALLDDALADGNLAALVVRVDSPGGSITASERIREAIARHRATGIPVVVSMANLAASGGYWVSTPASRIFAEPGTITGSIGVFAVIPTFERSLGELGITADGVRTTPLSGQPDFAGGLTPEVAAMIQANVESSYGRFLGIVAKARGKDPRQIDAIAQGRVWDGATARRNGLVDQFGGLDEALAYVAGAAKLEKGQWHPVFLGEDGNPYASLLERLFGDEESAPPAQARDWAGLVADRQFALARRALTDVERLLSARGVQAYCLECPVLPTDSAARRKGGPGLAAHAARLLGLI